MGIPLPPLSGASETVASVEGETLSLFLPTPSILFCCRICCKIDLLMILDDINSRTPESVTREMQAGGEMRKMGNL